MITQLSAIIINLCFYFAPDEGGPATRSFPVMDSAVSAPGYYAAVEEALPGERPFAQTQGY